MQFLEIYVGNVAQRKQLLYLDRLGDRIPVRARDDGRLWPELNSLPLMPWFEDVIKLSETLGIGLDFIRVDFLTSGGKVFVGELTSYVSCGDFSFDPDFYNKHFGKDWHPNYSGAIKPNAMVVGSPSD